MCASLPPRPFFFFFPLREGGELKMAAASLGVGGWERCLISPLLSCEAAPQPSWARGPGALPEAQNGGAAAAPAARLCRLSPRLGGESEKGHMLPGAQRGWGLRVMGVHLVPGRDSSRMLLQPLETEAAEGN